jgi:hypothetical protein
VCAASRHGPALSEVFACFRPWPTDLQTSQCIFRVGQAIKVLVLLCDLFL